MRQIAQYWIVSDGGIYEDGPYYSLQEVKTELAYLRRHWRGYLSNPVIERRMVEKRSASKLEHGPPISF